MTKTDPASNRSKAGTLILEETVPPGGMWSRVIPRGRTVRLTDLEGGGNVAALFYNADLPLERYNMPDTLKAQQVAFITEGIALYSDMGRILFSVTRDTCGWHDTICGLTTRSMMEARHGRATYQDHRNEFQRNSRDNLLVELGKWGLGKRDLVPNMNFFSKVTADATGALTHHANASAAGSVVELRAEMNVLLVLTPCPHPLDENPNYEPKPVGISLLTADPAAEDDACRLSHPENARGFINTETLFL